MLSNRNLALHDKPLATEYSSEIENPSKAAITPPKSTQKATKSGQIGDFMQGPRDRDLAGGGPVSRVLSRLHGVHRAGGQWQARCPSHEDREPSLSIGEGSDGRVLLRCHAGCDYRSILSAIGLEPRDLFPSNGYTYTGNSRAYQPPPPPRPTPKTPHSTKPQDPGPWRETKRFVYRDESGRPLYSKIRESSPAGGKRFRRSPAGIASSLYGLEKLQEVSGRILYISESEKDKDRLEELGAAAVSPGGATIHKSGIAPRFAEAIAKAGPRFVAILPHHDVAGREFAERALSTLESHDVQTVIVNIAKIDSPEGYDVADWLEDGGSLGELDEMSELVLCREDPYALNRTLEEEFRCTSPRWIGQRHRKTGYMRTLPGRCRKCLGCRRFFRAKRSARLMEGLRQWDRVVLIETETPAQYEALSRRLRRHGSTYVSIPFADGHRCVLTEEDMGGEVGGEVIGAEALKERVETIIANSSDAKRARIDGSKDWEKTGQRKGWNGREPEWEKIGETRLSPEQQVKVFRSFGCVPVKVLEFGNGGLLWSTKHLQGDELEKLYYSLGFHGRYRELAA